MPRLSQVAAVVDAWYPGQTNGTSLASVLFGQTLGDPSATGEPPRQLEGFQRVSLAPGASARVSFVITPQDESWWSDAANGWTQTAGGYQVYVGDSSALADLPLRGAFSMTSTPAARQVTVSAPSGMQAGKVSAVRVKLTASGDATLYGVRLALQLPQGWRTVPIGPTVFGFVPPGAAPAATFLVTPPRYAPNASAVVHATATVGNLQREAGVSVTVSG
jgi:beta-glucosidase